MEGEVPEEAEPVGAAAGEGDQQKVEASSVVDKLLRNSSSPPAASAEGGREDQDQDLLRPPQRPVECPLLLRRGAQPQGSSAGGTDGVRGRSLEGAEPHGPLLSSGSQLSCHQCV